MRYSACEKHEVISLVEQSSLPAKRTLAQLGIPRSTFYIWYDRYRTGGADALEDGTPSPRRSWNKIPGDTGWHVVHVHWSSRKADSKRPVRHL